MSVVAVRVLDEGYRIAADSIVVRGWSRRKDSKFAKLNEVNGLILGSVGSCEEGGLFYLYLKSHRPSPAEDSVLECVSEFAKWKHAKTGDASIHNEFFLGFDRHVFWICGYHVGRVHNFHAIGAGDDFATAALHLGHSPVEAVRTAIELSAMCEGPIIGFERLG
jgi:ATP-dependent protease HslVU (ClpYQ) peptidase subunit